MKGRQGGSSRVAVVVLVCCLPLSWLHGWFSAPSRSNVVRVATSGLPSGWEEYRDHTGTTFYRLTERAGARLKDLPAPSTATADVRSSITWLNRISEGLSVTVFRRASCTGEAFKFNLSHREPRCRSCLDTCQNKFPSGSPLHTSGGPDVRSFKVTGILGGVRYHHMCLGLFEYPEEDQKIHSMRLYTESDGCVDIGQSGAHFRLVMDRDQLPEEGVVAVRRAAETVDPPPPPPAKELAEVKTDGPDAPASRYQSRDWFKPVLRNRDVFQNWTQRFQTPETVSGERAKPCGVSEADDAIAEGIALVRAHLTFDTHPRPVDNPEEAEPLFRRAVQLAPDCVTPLLNLAILMVVRGDADAEAQQMIAEAVSREPGNAKALLWRAIYSELRSPQESGQLYKEAFAADNTLPMRYFGRPHGSWGTRSVPELPQLFSDPGTASASANEIQAKAMRKLLLFHEFAEYYGGHGSIMREEAAGFLDRWSIQLRRLIPPYPLAALREAYRELVRKKLLGWQGTTTPRWPENRWTQHNGPLARFSQAAILPRIESVSQRRLMPTYAFMGSYLRGGGIIPHLDREVCEYTLTVTIDAHPYSEVCPFGVAAEPNIIHETGYTDEPFTKNDLPPANKQLIIDSYVGDGALVRGRGVVHWRPQNTASNCTQFFLHFVRDNFQGDLN
eukprot:TRINITY_DN9782_c4_g1_i2.p1 TRINITY_DN9782_c4_g1~~TRINITY_DN9782_c4_g1_i2.p1  ORF type:complete len:672 (+),score=137.07 TRINITY_DN9782_c4_g1_i2:80-2095(+)